jgi:hypothetical protein
LRHQVSELLAGQEPAAAPALAAVPAPAQHEIGRHRPAGRRSPEETISRRTIGKVIGAAAVGVVGTAALIELHSHATPASGDAVTEADVTDAEALAEERAEAASSGSVISATLSTSAAVVVGSNSSSGAGVEGSSTDGRGGSFSGKLAQVHLTPGSGSTHPKTGQAGDLYVDKTGRLWFCTKTGSKSGWKQIG